MGKNILHIRGLSTPRWLLWVHGFVHGHILKSGGLDPESGVISSCYITGKCSLFREACITRMELLERTLQKDWANVDDLLVDYAALCAALAIEPTGAPEPTDSAGIRASERAANDRATKKAYRQSILKQLLATANHIRTEECIAAGQLEATGEKIKSIFSAYGHGLIMKPIYPGNLPALPFAGCVNDYRKAHSSASEALEKICATVKEAI